MEPGKRLSLILVLGCMACVTAVSMVIVIRDIRNEKVLLDRHEVTEGIFGENAQWRGMYYYSYEVDGLNYRKKDDPYEPHRTGEKVYVYYSPSNPNISTVNKPDPSHGDKWSRLVILSAICLGTSAFGLLQYSIYKSDFLSEKN